MGAEIFCDNGRWGDDLEGGVGVCVNPKFVNVSDGTGRKCFGARLLTGVSREIGVGGVYDLGGTVALVGKTCCATKFSDVLIMRAPGVLIVDWRAEW